ncbi:MAG: DNA methyltransferase [Saccharofermentanales bacterium]
MPRLTDQEQQDIFRFIEADKPLPDKYRFLLFQDKREVELVWNGKTNEVCNIVLPFQTIEQVDEARSEEVSRSQLSLDQVSQWDTRGRQTHGWTNKLIWGDNKLILSSLKNGPMREEIEKNGGIKLIYIDPPFDVGADFSMDIEIGEDIFTKKPNILEEIAYRDTWGNGADSFIAMIYERLMLMRDLLAEDGSIYVHCDWRLSSQIHLIMNEIFGSENFRNEIIWYYSTLGRPVDRFAQKHDTIFCYGVSKNTFFNIDDSKIPYSKEYIISHFRDLDDEGNKCRKRFDAGKWRTYYPDDGMIPNDVWDIPYENSMSKNRVAYPTQKPEALLERIIKSSTKEGDLVADFFCGSGTLAAVSENLNRKWIAADLGKFAIHTTRKRMIGNQRKLKADGKNYRAFEILNLGRYERQHFVGINPNLRDEEKRLQLAEKEAAFVDLILKAYRAEKIDGFLCFHGKRSGRLVTVGPVNLPVTRLLVEEIILECRQKHITKVDILGFEFEMGLFPNVLDEARNKGIDIVPKYIPVEVFDKRAIEKNQVVFHDVAAIEVKPIIKEGRKKGQIDMVAIQLTDFSVFYSQDSIQHAEASLNKGSKIVVEKGQIVKITKDAKGILSREILTKSWIDWIDYWAVDFNFENKREIILVKNEDNNEFEEQWTGDYIFENEWQSFRTKKDPSIELTSASRECTPGRRKIAVKVVDIFGNDTMTIVEVNVGVKG